MGKAPAFQFYASDFVMGTAEMSAHDVGVYMRMLCHEWLSSEESLPKTNPLLSRLLGGDTPSSEVLAKFTDRADGRIVNMKLEQIRDEMKKFREKQALNGSKGGRPRKPNESQAKATAKPKRNPTANPNESSSPSGEDTPAAGVCVTPAAETRGEVLQSDQWRLGAEEIAAANGKPKQEHAGSAHKEKPKKQIVSFIPPTETEVAEYCRERKNSLDPEQFVDFYASKGWKVGGQSMKDWKASVRTWEKRNGTVTAPAKQHVRDVGHSVEEIMEFRRQMGE